MHSLRTPVIGWTAGGILVPDIRRERDLAARVKQQLDRDLNRLLALPQGQSHGWQLAAIHEQRPATWEEFRNTRHLEVVAVCVVDHTNVIAAAHRSLLRQRYRFYLCPEFSWSVLEEIQKRYRTLWHKAEDNQTSSGHAFFETLAQVWGGERISSPAQLSI